MNKYIDFFELANPGRKTKKWQVITADGVNHLGLIKWFGRWRRYAFFPAANTVFEHQCLTDLSEFCRANTNSHLANRKLTT